MTDAPSPGAPPRPTGASARRPASGGTSALTLARRAQAVPVLAVFCARDGRVGDWCTRQRRSYFAIKLPNDWWVWAIDIQLDTYIDDIQLDYFNKQQVAPGDKVILMTAKPAWVKAVPERPERPERRQPGLHRAVDRDYKNLVRMRFAADGSLTCTRAASTRSGATGATRASSTTAPASSPAGQRRRRTRSTGR